MLKNIIIVENGKQYGFDTEQDLIRNLVCDNYYQLNENEKMKQLKIKAMANSLNRNIEIVEDIQQVKNKDISDKLVIINEKTFVLSLLNLCNIIMLENIDSDIYTEKMDKSQFSKNYIIVNKYAKQILQEIIDSY